MLVVYNEDDFSTNPLSLGHKDINFEYHIQNITKSLSTCRTFSTPVGREFGIRRLLWFPLLYIGQLTNKHSFSNVLTPVQRKQKSWVLNK